MIQESLNKLGVGWVELIGLITSFLFFTGLCYSYGYYAAGLNAEWIINLTTTKELLINNLSLGVCLVMAFMYFAMAWTDKGIDDHQRLYRLANVILITLGAVWWVRNGFSAAWQSITYLISFNALYVIFFRTFVFKFFGVLLILFVVPFINGFIAYDRKISSVLPVVNLKDEPKRWFLFDTYADQVILIDSTKREKNIRIVAINEIENIKVK